jgi:hypothetical protein
VQAAWRKWRVSQRLRYRNQRQSSNLICVMTIIHHFELRVIMNYIINSFTSLWVFGNSKFPFKSLSGFSEIGFVNQTYVNKSCLCEFLSFHFSNLSKNSAFYFNVPVLVHISSWNTDFFVKEQIYTVHFFMIGNLHTYIHTCVFFELWFLFFLFYDCLRDVTFIWRGAAQE